MELINLKPGARFNEGPSIFYDDELQTSFYRLRTAFAPVRANPGGLALIGEEADWRSVKRQIFILGIEKFCDTGELLVELQQLIQIYGIKNVYSRMTKVERDFMYFFNLDQRWRDQIPFRNPPCANQDGDISYHFNLARELMRAGRGTILFPDESNIPQMMQGFEKIPYNLNDITYPALGAVIYGIAAVYHYPTMEFEETRGYKEKKEYDPWAILK